MDISAYEPNYLKAYRESCEVAFSEQIQKTFYTIYFIYFIYFIYIDRKYIYC